MNQGLTTGSFSLLYRILKNRPGFAVPDGARIIARNPFTVKQITQKKRIKKYKKKKPPLMVRQHPGADICDFIKNACGFPRLRAFIQPYFRCMSILFFQKKKPPLTDFPWPPTRALGFLRCGQPAPFPMAAFCHLIPCCGQLRAAQPQHQRTEGQPALLCQPPQPIPLLLANAYVYPCFLVHGGKRKKPLRG